MHIIETGTEVRFYKAKEHTAWASRRLFQVPRVGEYLVFPRHDTVFQVTGVTWQLPDDMGQLRANVVMQQVEQGT
jgi:hypothetical protein